MLNSNGFIVLDYFVLCGALGALLVLVGWPGLIWLVSQVRVRWLRHRIATPTYRECYNKVRSRLFETVMVGLILGIVVGLMNFSFILQFLRI